MKILFCSPYSDAPDALKGGINTWGRYIMEYYKRYGKNQVQLIPISFDRSISSAESTNLIWRIFNGYHDLIGPVRRAIRLMDSEKPDVVHICTSAGLGIIRDFLLVRAANRRGVKSVVHLHFGRIPILSQQHNLEWKMLSKVLRMCNVPVVMNRQSERTLILEGFNNVTYLPNPLGLGALKVIKSSENKYNRVQRRLLYCGHVLKTKGVLELVEACRRIPNIELRIVGKCFSEVKNDMQIIAKKSGNDISWLNFVGEVNHEEVIQEFFQADIFVFPSYSEGFPNVILEAMACGCPIVSSNVGAIPEMLDIDGEQCGICFDPKSSDNVYNAIISLIEDEDLKQQLAIRAKMRVNNMYAIPRVWEQLINIWNNGYDDTTC